MTRESCGRAGLRAGRSPSVLPLKSALSEEACGEADNPSGSHLERARDNWLKV